MLWLLRRLRRTAERRAAGLALMGDLIGPRLSVPPPVFVAAFGVGQPAGLPVSVHGQSSIRRVGEEIDTRLQVVVSAKYCNDYGSSAQGIHEGSVVDESRCRAARVGEGREHPRPCSRAGQVLVAPLTCGICGSDLNLVSSQAAMPDLVPAIVLGHEFVGELLDYGPGTDRSSPIGTPVTSVPYLGHRRADRSWWGSPRR